jgi:hypothetical protein
MFLWRHVAQFNVYPTSSKEFSILIEGIVGDEYWDYYGNFDKFHSENHLVFIYNQIDQFQGWSGGQGDIAIDDFDLKDSECQPIGNCDFEEDTCKTNSECAWIKKRK